MSIITTTINRPGSLPRLVPKPRARRAGVQAEVPARFRSGVGLPTVAIFGNMVEPLHLLRMAAAFKDQARFIIIDDPKKLGFSEQDGTAFAKGGIIYEDGKFIKIPLPDRPIIHYGFKFKKSRASKRLEEFGIPISIPRNPREMLSEKCFHLPAFGLDGVPAPETLYFSSRAAIQKRRIQRITDWKVGRSDTQAVVVTHEGREVVVLENSIDPAEIARQVQERGWEQVVLKPSYGAGGMSNEFIGIKPDLGENIQRLSAAIQARKITTLLVQERIIPIGHEKGIDFNFRVFGGVDEQDNPICFPDFIIRMGKFGDIISHHWGAKWELFGRLKGILGLTQDQMDHIQKSIYREMPRAMGAVLRHASPSRWGARNQIDYCGFDVMVNITDHNIACQFIEGNSDYAGGYYGLYYLDASAGIGLANRMIGTMVRRAQAYSEQL